MTKTEAIKMLKNLKDSQGRSTGFIGGFPECMDMAIQALSQEPLEPVLSHSELTGLIYVYFGGEKYEITEQAIEAVRAIQEPMRDTEEQ